MSSKSKVAITELDNDTVLIDLLEAKESLSQRNAINQRQKKSADGGDLGAYVELLEDRIALAHHLINDLRTNLEQEKFKNSMLRKEAVANADLNSTGQETH